MLAVKPRDQESAAVVLMKAENIVGKEIFQNQYTFTGFLPDEHYDDKPASLTALVQMILDGTNIQTQTGITILPKQLRYQYLTF